jgi:digalactosyldiacylglycerol synthase
MNGGRFPRYRVFVNPSTSDVLCTATAEALAMGKKVVIPDHPSNSFFKQFRNTYMYEDPAEMVPLLRRALKEGPAPISAMEQ